jgi:hypothetical protein
MRHLLLSVLRAVVAAVVLATPAFAARTEFIGLLDGKRVTGGTACFYPAVADDGFFAKFLSSDDIRCLPADKIIDMPVGNWNMYLDRQDPAYTSNEPIFQTGDFEEEIDRQGYRGVGVDLVPAGTLRFTRRVSDGERAAAYIHSASPALIRPMRPGQSEMLIPSGKPVLPLLVRNGTISRIGRMTAVNSDGFTEAVFDETSPGKRHVVVLLRLPENVRGAAEGFEAPDIRLRLPDGRQIKPLLAPRSGAEIDRSLLIFEQVPAGPAEVVVEGRFWRNGLMAVPATTAAVQVLDQAFEAQPAGAMILRWSVPREAAADLCRMQEARNRDRVLSEVRLSLCHPACTVLARRTIGGEKGIFELGSLDPGIYRAELVHPFGTVAKEITVRSGEQAKADISVASVVITGSIAVGNLPMAADIIFSNGTTKTDLSGRYTAVLPASPGRNFVTIVPCDGSAHYKVTPKSALDDLSIFDVHVPSNEIAVTVLNAATAAPVHGVSVTLSALVVPGDEDGDYLDLPPTDSAGTTRLSRADPERWYRVCAGRADFRHQCVDDFRVGEEETRDVTLRLEPAEARRGRVVTDGDIVAGLLYWIAPQGHTTEWMHLARDGQFRFRIPHGPDEHLVFVARNRPLVAFRATPASDDAWEIQLPNAPVVTFTIVPSTQSSRLALEIGGLLVPEEAFARYQMTEGQAPSVNGHLSVNVRGVAQTGPVAVLAGPPTDYLPPNMPPDTDLSSLPQFRASFRRFPVTGSNVVIATERP